MTESGNPKDNAIAERVNNTIKNELLHKRIFVTFNEAVRAVDKAIAFYNTEHPHSSLDWHTPEQAHHMCREIKKTLVFLAWKRHSSRTSQRTKANRKFRLYIRANKISLGKQR